MRDRFPESSCWNTEEVSRQNEQVDRFIEKTLPIYRQPISDLYEESFINLQETQHGLLAISVDKTDNRKLLRFSGPEYSEKQPLLEDHQLPADSHIDRFFVSPGGNWLLVIGKTVFSNLPTAYLYDTKNMQQPAATFPQCGSGCFVDESHLFLVQEADINDISQVNYIWEVFLGDDGVSEMHPALEIEEMNVANLYCSRDKRTIFVQVLTDYHINDAVYYREVLSQEDFTVLVDGYSGRWQYAGSDEEFHYFLTNRSGNGIEIAALDRSQPDIHTARQVHPPRALTILPAPCSCLLGELFVLFTPEAFGVGMEVRTKDGTLICKNPLGEGLYCGNLNHFVFPSSALYFTFESADQSQSIWKLDESGKITNIVPAKWDAGEIIRESPDLPGGTVSLTYSKRAKFPAKTLVVLRKSMQSDLLGNICCFQSRTPLIPWLQQGGVVAEVGGISPASSDTAKNDALLSKLLSLLQENGYTTPSQTGLWESGFTAGPGTLFGLRNPSLVGAMGAYALRCDLDSYSEDATGYMYVDFVGDPHSEQREAVLQCSPLHNVRKDIHYPACMITNNDYNLLVPVYHGERLISKLQQSGKGTFLHRSFYEENFPLMLAELLAFFHAALEGSEFNNDHCQQES